MIRLLLGLTAGAMLMYLYSGADFRPEELDSTGPAARPLAVELAAEPAKLTVPLQAEPQRRAEEKRIAARRLAAEITERKKRVAAEADRAVVAERAGTPERLAEADRVAERLIGDLSGTLFTLSFEDSGVAEGFDELVDSLGGAYFTRQFPMDALEKYQFGRRVLYFHSDELEYPVLLPRRLSREVLGRVKAAAERQSLDSIAEVHVRLRAGGEISRVEVAGLALLQEVNR